MTSSAACWSVSFFFKSVTGDDATAGAGADVPVGGAAGEAGTGDVVGPADGAPAAAGAIGAAGAAGAVGVVVGSALGTPDSGSAAFVMDRLLLCVSKRRHVHDPVRALGAHVRAWCPPAPDKKVLPLID